jgi:hypothetical protein
MCLPQHYIQGEEDLMTRQLVAVWTVLAAFLAAGGAAAADPHAVEVWQAEPTTIFEAAEVDIDAFRWIARPVVVFSDTPANPAFQRQLELIEDRIGALALRDVVVVIDSDPAADSDLRRQLRPRGFMLVLMNKSGDVALRKPSPWHVREITRSIDKTPERQQEVRDTRELLTD